MSLRRFFSSHVLLAAILSLSSPALAAERWAVLVGVNDYAELEDLAYCVRDMQSLRDQFVESGFAERRVFFLHDKAGDSGSLPNKTNIERELRLILNLVEKDDLVVIAFSGHGIFLDGKSWLCPAEANLDRAAETMISVDAIYKSLQECPAAMKLLLVDACRNDPRPAGQKSAKAAVETSKLAESLTSPPKGVLVLTSCAPGQLSWEDNALQHGVFMNYVVEGLGGRADQNKNGSISLLELYEFASLETKTYVARTRRQVQTPALKGELEGVFEIGSARASLREPITNAVGMKFVYIPSGEFLMGRPETAEQFLREFPLAKVEDFDGETPQHRVRISQSFYLGTYEVTRGQFRQFVNDTGYRTAAEREKKGTGWDEEQKIVDAEGAAFSWRYTNYSDTDECPVVNVTWSDAVAYCRWATKQDGRHHRLPTEAEWEYACRAGTTTRYYWGDDHIGISRYANLRDQTGASEVVADYLKYAHKEEDGYFFLAPVGRFRPNAWGLHDMAGNACEFVEDWYDEAWYGKSPADDPVGPATGTHKIVRGGHWNSSVWMGPRSPRRGRTVFGDRYSGQGFRVAIASPLKRSPAAQAAYDDLPIPTFDPIRIHGATGAGLSFVVESGADHWTREVPAGGVYELTDDREWVIRFNRGGKNGDRRVRLKAGDYEFRATSTGWELFRRAE